MRRSGAGGAVVGVRCAAQKVHTFTCVAHTHSQELRIETHTFGPGTPVALVGMRCMVRPTDAECDAANAVLLAAKKEAEKVRTMQKRGRSGCGAWPSRDAKDATHPQLLRTPPQPRVVIAGTLANVSSATPESVVMLTSGTASSSHDSDGDDLDVNFDTPLPVFEDTGRPDAAQPASHGATTSQGAVETAPHAPAEAAAPAGADLGPAPWQPAPHAAPHSAPYAGAAPDGPRSSLHHEILAFAQAATPSQVRFLGGAFRLRAVLLEPPLPPRCSPKKLTASPPPHTAPSSATWPPCPPPSTPSPAPPSACGPSRAPCCLAARPRGWHCPGPTSTSSCWARLRSWPTRRPGFHGEGGGGGGTGRDKRAAPNPLSPPTNPLHPSFSGTNGTPWAPASKPCSKHCARAASSRAKPSSSRRACPSSSATSPWASPPTFRWAPSTALWPCSTSRPR